MITAQDDYFHERSDDPNWNESAWFSFMVPERHLSGFVYFYHRPNLGYTVGGVGLWDPTAEETYDCLFYDWGTPYPTPDGAEMFDFGLPNGLAVECVTPLEQFRFDYQGTGAYGGEGGRLEAEWTAIMPPHSVGLPSGQEDWGKGHYHQAGRMVGTVEVDGERFEIDCFSERDHSWGVRKLDRNPRAVFPWGIASEEHAFHVLAISERAAADDPVFGTSERIISGWYRESGTTGHISGGTCSVGRQADGRPSTIRVEATDEHGRPLRANGQVRNNLNWHGYPFLFMWWNQVEWDLDGDIAWGESLDYWPFQQARRFQNQLRHRGTATELTDLGGIK